MAHGVRAAESSSRTRRVIAGIAQAAVPAHWAGRESPLPVPWGVPCSQRGPAGQQSLAWGRGAAPARGQQVALAGLCSHLVPGPAQQQPQQEMRHSGALPPGFAVLTVVFWRALFPQRWDGWTPKPQSQLRSRIYWALSRSTFRAGGGGGRKPMATADVSVRIRSPHKYT